MVWMYNVLLCVQYTAYIWYAYVQYILLIVVNIVSLSEVLKLYITIKQNKNKSKNKNAKATSLTINTLSKHYVFKKKTVAI